MCERMVFVECPYCGGEGWPDDGRCDHCNGTGSIEEPAVPVTEEDLDDFATEPTEQGLQFVIPGCEHDRSRGPDQGDLFK